MRNACSYLGMTRYKEYFNANFDTFIAKFPKIRDQLMTVQQPTVTIHVYRFTYNQSLALNMFPNWNGPPLRTIDTELTSKLEQRYPHDGVIAKASAHVAFNKCADPRHCTFETRNDSLYGPNKEIVLLLSPHDHVALHIHCHLGRTLYVHGCQ